MNRDGMRTHYPRMERSQLPRHSAMCVSDCLSWRFLCREAEIYS